MTPGYLVDTSVFVAAEQRRPLGEPPPATRESPSQRSLS